MFPGVGRWKVGVRAKTKHKCQILALFLGSLQQSWKAWISATEIGGANMSRPIEATALPGVRRNVSPCHGIAQQQHQICARCASTNMPACLLQCKLELHCGGSWQTVGMQPCLHATCSKTEWWNKACYAAGKHFQWHASLICLRPYSWMQLLIWALNSRYNLCMPSMRAHFITYRTSYYICPSTSSSLQKCLT